MIHMPLISTLTPPPTRPHTHTHTHTHTQSTKHNCHELRVRRLWFYSLPTSRTNRALRCQILLQQQQQQQNSHELPRQTPVPRQTSVRRLFHVRRLWFYSLPTSRTNRAYGVKYCKKAQFPLTPSQTPVPRQTPVRRLFHVRRLWFYSLPTSRTNRALRCPRGEVSLRPWVA